MVKKAKANKVLVIIMALVLFSMILATLATMTKADTLTIPAMTKSAVFTIGSQTVTVDGQTYRMDVAPYIDANGRTQVPVRYLADALGAYSINWDAADQTVDLGFDNPGHVDLTIGRAEIGYANSEHPMDTAPVIIPPGRTMLPARFVAEAVGDVVTWDASKYTVTVTPPGYVNGTNGVKNISTAVNGGMGNTVDSGPGHSTTVH